MKATFLTLILLAIFSSNINAQLTGTKTIDNTGAGDYLTFNAAITDLNNLGVGVGGVTFNVISGQTFTETPLAITVSGTVSNPIVFQKTGAGSNPEILGTDGTQAPPFWAASTGDAIIKIAGGDYITIDGLNLIDNPANVNNTTRMEYGVLLLRSSADSSGSKNITIRNCKISLNTSNIYSIGIASLNYTADNFLLNNTPSGETNKRVSNVSIYSDTIVNCYSGIVFHGINTLYDQNLMIGTDGGNLITGFGGGGLHTYGIDVRRTNNIFISNNRVSSANGTASSQNVYGIYTFECFDSDCEINNNEVSVVKNNESTNSGVFGIYNGANGIVKLYDNEIHSSFGNGSFSNPGHLYLLRHYGSGTERIEVYNNLIRNNSATGINMLLTCIMVNTQNADSVIIYDNVIRNNTHSGDGFASRIEGIIGKNIINNKFYSNTHSNQSGFGITGMNGMNISGNEIYSNNNCTGIMGSGNINDNKIYDLYVNNNELSEVRGIFINGHANVYNNFVSNLRNWYSGANSVGALVGIYIQQFSGFNINLFYNTVYLNSQMGLNGNVNFNSQAVLYLNTSPNGELRMKNNIFVNTSNHGALSHTDVFHSVQNMLNQYSMDSDNNCFYTNPGEGNFIYKGPDVEISGIGQFRNFVSPRDANSFLESPPFVNIAGNDPSLLTNVPTQLESGGVPITSPVNITNDFFGNLRNVLTPDVGAVEFDGTPLDNDVEASDVTFSGTVFSSGGVVTNFTSQVRNNSNQPRSFKVFRTVSPGGYSDSLIVTNLSSKKDTTVIFKNFPFTNNETYTITDSVYLSGDQIASNNVTSGQFTPTNPNTFLIINGHNQSRDRLVDAINEDGRFTDSYDMIDIQNFNSSLRNWTTVIVLFGDEWNGSRSWTPALRDSMKTFIDNSDLSDKKTLIVFGNSLGNVNDNENSPANPEDTTFYRQYLKARYLQSTWGYGGGSLNTERGKGGGENPFSNDDGRIRGLGSFSSITDDTTETPWTNSDLISPHNGSTPVLIPFSESGDGDSCVAVVYGDIVSDYNTFYSSISFSYFKSEDGGGKSSLRGMLSGASLIFDVLVDWVEDGEGALPVDLLSFTASVDDNNVFLNWETSWEENNDRFELYRKPFGSENEWKKIGTVTGNGNTNTVKSYSFTDKNLPTGKYEYKLKQFDYNGNSNADWDLNQVVSIGLPVNFELSQNYPNPFNPTTKIDFQIPIEGFTKLVIYDMSGREVAILVNEVLTPGYHTVEFNGANFASGVYFYRLVTANSVITKRAVLVK